MSRRKRSLPRGWYPFDGEECRREIRSYIEGWSPPSPSSVRNAGGIVPHAGWYFSGKLAARVFCALASRGETNLVALYGGHLGSEGPPYLYPPRSGGEGRVRECFSSFCILARTLGPWNP